MRRPFTILLVATIFSTFLPLAVMAETGVGKSNLIIDVQREIRIERAGITWLIDEFELKALAGEDVVIDDFWVGFHPSYSDERRSFDVWQGSDWIPLTYDESSKGGLAGYELALPSSVTLSEGSSLRIRSSYLFVNIVWEGQGKFNALLPGYPGIAYNVSSFEYHIQLPQDAQFEDIVSSLNFTESEKEGIWTLDHISYSIPAYANENITLSYVPAADDDYILDCEELERKITVKRGRLKLEDTFNILNTGAPKSQIHIKLPLEASDIKARDGVGPVVVSHQDGDSDTDVYVETRWNLLNGDRWSFTVSYEMPSGEYITTTGGSLKLTFPNSDFPFYVRDLTAVVTRPESEDQSFQYGALLPSERPGIVADLPPASIMPIVRPVVGVLIVVGLVGVSTFLRRREPKAVVKPIEVGLPSLSDFAKDNMERIALLKELVGLEKELSEEEITREEFDQRTASINLRLGELTRSLKQLRETLEERDPSLSPVLAEISKAEDELERIERDLRNLDIRLRARRVSRRGYERRRKDRIRRRTEAIKRIEKALESMGSRD